MPRPIISPEIRIFKFQPFEGSGTQPVILPMSQVYENLEIYFSKISRPYRRSALLRRALGFGSGDLELSSLIRRLL